MIQASHSSRLPFLTQMSNKKAIESSIDDCVIPQLSLVYHVRKLLLSWLLEWSQRVWIRFITRHKSADSCQLQRLQYIFPHRIERSCLPDFVTILQWKYMWSIDENERSDFFDFRNDTTKSAAQNFSILLTSVQCKQLQSHFFASLSAGGLESVKYWSTIKRLLVGITKVQD